MNNVHVDGVDSFYSLLRKGTKVDEFLQQYGAVFQFIKSKNLLDDYRLGRGRLKRLRDEIAPAARFVRLHAAPQDWIQFPLDSSVPDCNWHHVSGRHLKIEITIAQARERLNLMTELNNTGEGRGFLGLADDQPTKDFLIAMQQERRMYSTDEVQKTMAHAIKLCVNNKLHSRGDMLLIEAPLNSLQDTRWLELKPALAELARVLSFSEVFLVGYHNNGDLCLKLK